MIFQKHPTNIISCDFRGITKIFDKLDVGPLETLKKWKVFWEQCLGIHQVCHDYQWADICVRVLASQPSSKPNSSILFTTSSNFFRMIRLYINCCLCLKYRNLGELDLRQISDICFLQRCIFFKSFSSVVTQMLKISGNCQENKHQPRSLFLDKNML